MSHTCIMLWLTMSLKSILIHRCFHHYWWRISWLLTIGVLLTGKANQSITTLIVINSTIFCETPNNFPFISILSVLWCVYYDDVVPLIAGFVYINFSWYPYCLSLGTKKKLQLGHEFSLFPLFVKFEFPISQNEYLFFILFPFQILHICRVWGKCLVR